MRTFVLAIVIAGLVALVVDELFTAKRTVNWNSYDESGKLQARGMATWAG